MQVACLCAWEVLPPKELGVVGVTVEREQKIAPHEFKNKIQDMNPSSKVKNLMLGMELQQYTLRFTAKQTFLNIAYAHDNEHG